MIVRILGVLFLVAGVYILVYHGFNIPKEHEGKLGPIEVRMNETQHYEIPVWAGVAFVVAGGGALLWAGRRR
jgi:protein-S-isoprenylcysteine O-methyltransferase Ste14